MFCCIDLIVLSKVVVGVGIFYDFDCLQDGVINQELQYVDMTLPMKMRMKINMSKYCIVI